MTSSATDKNENQFHTKVNAEALDSLKSETDAEAFDPLKLENQLCFPLYAVSRQITKTYAPFLEPLDLTYPQYITMMVLWEHGQMNVKSLGELLYLGSGTLTPLLKKLEQKGYLTRTRDHQDERNLIVSITEEGKKLKEEARCVPEKMGSCMCLTPQEALQLHGLLRKLMGQLT